QTAKADPDGYTLAVVSTGHVVNYVLYKDLPYDSLKDLAGVAPLASLPSVLVVSSALGVKSVKELVAVARARPGELNYGTAGVGSAAHINSEKFNVAAGIQAVHVTRKGTPPILTETMGGRVHFAWVPSVSSMGPVKDGKLLALAVSTPARIAALPEVPTIAEAGFPGGEFNFWVGLLAPARTPPDIVARLNAQINRALQSPEMNDRLAKLGGEPMSMSAPQFDAFIRQEYELLGKVVRENRAGAGGSIGSAVVAREVPDGYTLLINSNAHSVNPAIYAKLPYDTTKDFSDIVPLAVQPNVLVVNAGAPYRSVMDLVNE